MDTDQAPPSQRVRRVRAWALAVLAVVLLLAGVALVAAPGLRAGKLGRGGVRLYRCFPLGGSLPIDVPGMVGFQFREFRPGVLLAVHDGDQVVVATEVHDATGASQGVAVWVAAQRFGEPRRPMRAANDVARAVADNPDGSVESAGWAGDAATDCVQRYPRS